ncbi:MAG: glycoside hydrolase family 2 TIM barrel-domain containing protein [Paludibacter sp.]|nr:glycoside hydrolase family 2 TIM barrel-domain containing protein [Paludibacter sp.]
MKKGFLLLCLMLLVTGIVDASPRLKYSINENWRFLRQDVPGAMLEKLNDDNWQTVNIPHTWNAKDVMDDEAGYYRGVGWYRRVVNIPVEYSGKQITILFEGANQEVELFVNGKTAGTHVGGYTRFSFDITPFIQLGENNTFAVKVNNRYNEFIPTLTADFTFFGGIYRDVFLIVTEKQQVSTTHYASDGVYLSTPEVTEKLAKVEVKTMLNNAAATDSRLKVEHTIIHPDKSEILVVSKKIKLAKHTVNQPEIQKIDVVNPALWSPESPAIYTVRTRVYDEKSKKLLDEVFQPMGLRWFEFSAEKGFYLNGNPYKLIGTNRHQCYDGMGNALPDEIHVRDVLLLKEMGGNFLRVSHYPQDPVVMEMCDKLGIITSVEIPVVNAITEHETFYRNCIEMAREMVFQDYNRPSVLIWAYMNEVLLRPPFRDQPERHASYLKSVEALAIEIEKQIREDDPYRYTLIPFHGSVDLYHNAGLTKIPMIIGWNLYQGWYGGTFDGFGKFLDEAQKKLKGIPFIITEYGADVDPRLHSFEPTRFDYTQEWANLYHESYIKDIMERTYVVGANIWNLNDFHSEDRGNAVPHINNKGITSTDREFKDTYLQYQALFRKDPIVNIGGRNWNIRGGNADKNYTSIQPVKVYSNLGEVEFFLNGISLGKEKTTDAIAEFNVPFVHGENVLEAIGYAGKLPVRDLIRVDFRMIASDLKDEKLPFESINVMLGSKRYFEEKDKSVIWLPEKPYTPGSWGYVGGKNYVKRTRHGQQPASDLNILNTTIDPVFQTMRHGIESFKLDVPDGEYTVSLYFAELMSKTTKVLVYNLGDDAIADDMEERIFNVDINGKRVIYNLNVAREFGELNAVTKKFIVQVQQGKGISIDFLPVKDEAILNAIRVYRNY